MSERFRGAIKWFNEQKGYGFICPDCAGGRAADVFVHVSALNAAKIRAGDLYEGRRIEFSQGFPKQGAKKICAMDLKLLD